MSPPPSTSKLRLYILTASVTGITATGAWYGAGLKARRDFQQETQKTRQASLADRIAQLEHSRARLVRQRGEVEGKIAALSGTSSPAASTMGGGAGGGEAEGR